MYVVNADCTDAYPDIPLLKLTADSADQMDGGRPAGVLLLAKMDVVGAAILLALAGMSTWFVVEIQSVGDVQMILTVVAAVFYCLAVLHAITGYGLSVGKPWARRLAECQAIIYILIGVAFLYCVITSKFIRRSRKASITFVLAGLGAVAGGGIVLWYLHKPNIIQYFDEMYQNPEMGTEREMWIRRVCMHLLDWIRTELDGNVLGCCNTLGLNTVNGFRAALDKIQ